jgi:hypothetical protein
MRERQGLAGRELADIGRLVGSALRRLQLP